MSIALMVGILTAASVYLFMQRGMVRIVLGFVLISHAANLLLFSAGNVAFRAAPFSHVDDPAQRADPLPQAFVLTAIVIAFAISMFMVTLAITTTTDDDTEAAPTAPAKLAAVAHLKRTGDHPTVATAAVGPGDEPDGPPSDAELLGTQAGTEEDVDADVATTAEEGRRPEESPQEDVQDEDARAEDPAEDPTKDPEGTWATRGRAADEGEDR